MLTSCASCAEPLPIDVPTRTVTCASCSAQTEVAVDVWGDLLVLLDDEYELLEEGRVRHHTTSIASMDAHASFTRTMPRCACGVALPLDASSDVSCACGRVMHVGPLPSWLSVLSPTAQAIYHADANASFAKPTALTCPRCGGALDIEKSVTRCRFCATNVAMTVRAGHQPQTFYVRFDGETVRARRARVAREANEYNARNKPT